MNGVRSPRHLMLGSCHRKLQNRRGTGALVALAVITRMSGRPSISPQTALPSPTTENAPPGRRSVFWGYYREER
jgi:hypothetical protein